jgi:hypothetical protein
MLSRRLKTKSRSIAVDRNSNSLSGSTLNERRVAGRPSFLTLRVWDLNLPLPEWLQIEKEEPMNE